MTEVIEVLALNKAKCELKLDTLRKSKSDNAIVIEHLEAMVKDYEEAIIILNNHASAHRGGHNQTIHG